MSDFTNNTVDINFLPKYQETPFIPIHKKYWNVMVINLLIFAIILFVITAIVLVSVYKNTDMGLGFYISILVFVFGFIAFLFWINSVALKKRGYAVREKDLLYKSGVLSTTTTVIPFSRIQHIAVNEGMFSRMYNLASLEVYTAGGNSSDLGISGIEKEKAHEIKEFLMNNINDNDNSNDKDKPSNQ